MLEKVIYFIIMCFGIIFADYIIYLFLKYVKKCEYKNYIDYFKSSFR